MATWRRLSQSPLADVRKFAIKAVLDRDEAQFVYDHPELLKDPDEQVRHKAVRCLESRGDKRAIPMLREALQDSHTQTWAFRGLIKYKPDDLDAILRQGLKHDNNWIRAEAGEELVRRGDKEATARFINRIAALKDHKHDPKGMGSEHIYTDDLCRLIIEVKLSAAVPALRQAYANKCENIRRPVSGALAAFGDKDALRELRRFAGTGGALDRCDSIKMLGLVGDTESLPALRDALNDHEPWVREAAKEAIAKLEKKPAGSQPTNQDKQK